MTAIHDKEHQTDRRRFPLTPAQYEICTGQLLSPESPLYNMGMLYNIQGYLNVNRLLHAWKTVVAKNTGLRIRLYACDNKTVQAIEEIQIPVEQHDFRSVNDAEQHARNWIQNDLNVPMDLYGDLVAVSLFQIADQQWLWYCKQHHVITDASAFAAIWRHIVSEYENTASNDKNTTGNETATFTDYITAVQDRSTLKNIEARNYWQSKELSPSPTLYGRRPSLTSTEAARNTEFFKPVHALQLEKLIESDDVRSLSPHMARFQVLLTVLFAYIYRISGQSSVTIATTAPNRSDRQFANTAGLFVELLPLQISIVPNETFATLLEKVKLETLLFLQHSTSGASTWVQRRDVSVVLNYLPLTMDPLEGTSVTTEWLHTNHMERIHALRFHAMDWNNSGQISLAIDTNNSCFNPQQANDAQQHWLSLFDAFSTDRSQSIDSINILDEKQKPKYEKTIQYTRSDSYIRSSSANNSKKEVLESINATDDIVIKFDTIAKAQAQKNALIENEKILSYQDLSRKIDVLASHLIDNGIGINDRIAVLLPRCLSVPVALFGILKAGAAYVPIETDNPPERIQHLLETTGTCLIITNEESNKEYGTHVDRILLDDLGGLSTADNVHHSRTQFPVVPGNQPAYILYTSGSTGQPKGVVISRAALFNYCNWAADYYIGADSAESTLPSDFPKEPKKFAFFTPLGFDLTVTSLFVPLISGGCLHVYRSTSNHVDNGLIRVIEDNQVQIVKLTPAHLNMMKLQDLSDSSIEQLIVGGEDLKCSLAQEIYQAFGKPLIIHNEYGPTEATVGCIVYQFDPEIDIVGSVPIGKPVADMNVVVLNDALNPQPDGVAGNLYITGPSLANGYWQNEAQTKQHFIELAPHRIYYDTGDRVRKNERDQLVYLGREDQQIKIRGARVELGEIESAVLQCSDVDSCVAIAVAASEPSNAVIEESFCSQCGLSSHYPDTSFNDDGVCNLCTEFEHYQGKANIYFETMAELAKIAQHIKKRRTAKYDCIMLLSGGKDSTYALAQLVDLGLSVLAYTLDNGYLSTEAKANIKNVCQTLKVDHEFAQTPEMRKIFAESLERYSNVCHGCFRTIYTLSMKRAFELKIPAIFTGLSRGQFFETRLNSELFSNPTIDAASIDATVLSARKAYHRTDDAVSRLLDTRLFQDDEVFKAVEVHDFYRYCDVGLDELLAYLQQKLRWIRPKDTGRSTNCLINDIGIYVHKQERGFHNYALPYSWDVRMGHKEREAALKELDDEIDIKHVQQVLSEVGYTPRARADDSNIKIAVFVTSKSNIVTDQIKRHIKRSLPDWIMPHWIIQLDELPLNKNGKVDRTALPALKNKRDIADTDYMAPSTDIEKQLVRIWCEHLKLDHIGIRDNFFALGGDSLSAIRIGAAIDRAGYAISNAELFKYQTIEEVAERCEALITAKQTPADSKQSSEPTGAFSSLNTSQLDKLSTILARSSQSDKQDDPT